jgi:glycerol-3-phosphate acyltransferase PlsY
LTILGIIIGLLVIIRHKENIKRLINGTESKLSFSKDKKDKK